MGGCDAESMKIRMPEDTGEWKRPVLLGSSTLGFWIVKTNQTGE